MDLISKYYYILGLNENATQDEIKKAYRKLSQKFHPDKNNGDKFFEERFREINNAYNFLINQDAPSDKGPKGDDSKDNEKKAPTENESLDEIYSPRTKIFFKKENNYSSVQISKILLSISISIILYGYLQKFLHSPIADFLIKVGLTTGVPLLIIYTSIAIVKKKW